jgi:hypothetical protein
MLAASGVLDHHIDGIAGLILQQLQLAWGGAAGRDRLRAQAISHPKIVEVQRRFRGGRQEHDVAAGELKVVLIAFLFYVPVALLLGCWKYWFVDDGVCTSLWFLAKYYMLLFVLIAMIGEQVPHLWFCCCSLELPGILVFLEVLSSMLYSRRCIV